jgi:aspartokinase
MMQITSEFTEKIIKSIVKYGNPLTLEIQLCNIKDLTEQYPKARISIHLKTKKGVKIFKFKDVILCCGDTVNIENLDFILQTKDLKIESYE